MISYKLQGFDELRKKLLNLDRKVAKKIVKKAVRDAQKITLKVAKENAEIIVGGEMGSKISKALKILSKTKKGSYSSKVMIDPKKAEEFVYITKDGTRYYIPTAIESGHKKVGGGTVQAIPFMRKAADLTEKEKKEKLEKDLKDGIEKA